MVIAATSWLTLVGAVVAIKSIAVVAGFVALFTLCDVLARYSIATARRSAAVETGIGRYRVAVITLFTTFPDEAVTATSDLAGAGARIRVDFVAIITSLLTIDLTITAGLTAAAAVAAIAALTIAVITTLPRRSMTIAADG
jgi:hypothetical protein